jgi:3-oxoacyl-[acyl-carrier protein] reductase
VDLGIAGRRAAVAAGTAGLGLATAKALAAEGVSVAVCGRDADRLEAALAEISDVAVGSNVWGIVADVSTTDGATEFHDRSVEQLGGPLDILVPNAGGPPPGTFATTSLDDYRTAFEMNCLSTVALCRSAVPAMRSAKWGRVVAITSIGAREPISYLAASSTARAAVTSFLKVLSREVASDGVTVNSLQPGSHRTARISSLSGGDVDRVRAGIPVGDLGDAADFGAVAAFLCSRHARFVTGVGLPVDGGLSHGM